MICDFIFPNFVPNQSQLRPKNSGAFFNSALWGRKETYSCLFNKHFRIIATVLEQHR